jgi:hypothetical protein
MIDYDHFWAKPGSVPGMSGEDSREHLEMSAAALQQSLGIPGAFDWSMIPGMNPGPGRTPEQIAECERELSVRLPEVLRQAYARQDGGYVLDTEFPFRVYPLDEIDTPDDASWEYFCFDKGEEADQELFFEFAEDDFGGRFFLRYSADHSGQEPAVFVYHGDTGNTELCEGSVTKFFEWLLRTDAAPSVDWAEVAALAPVARETVDLSPLYHGRPAEKEQVLARVGRNLVLYVRERTPESESYTKTTLPEPLKAGEARLQQSHPGITPTHGLMLQPKNSRGIVSVRSRRTSRGGWKNDKERGVPVYVEFESADPERLRALRVELFGQKAADRADAEEKRQQKFEESMMSLSPDEQHSAMMQMMMQMRGRPGGMPATDAPLPPGAPPEAVALHEMMQKKLREIEERARGHIAKHPVDPKLLAELGGDFRGMPQHPGPDEKASETED